MPFISQFKIEDLSFPIRLDRYVSENMRLLSRSQIKVRQLKAKLNGKDVKLSRLVKPGDLLELFWDDAPPCGIIPENIALEIIWENEKCFVINKAQGMVVHPGAGNRRGTLANALCFLANNNEQFCNTRAGIVHRLDKDTSGLIIAAKDEETHAFLSEQFKTRTVKKTYAAIVCGAPKENKGKIETFIARDTRDRKKFAVCDKGRYALTYYKTIKKWQNHSLVLLRLKTGRTHQLRVHLRFIGCPILGDPIYGNVDKQFASESLMLHSKKMEITIPGETIPRKFFTELPERFIETIKKLNKMETRA